MLLMSDIKFRIQSTKCRNRF